MVDRNTKIRGVDNYTEESPTFQDVNDTNNTVIDLAGVGTAQNAYQILQANDVFENKDFLAADEFVDSDGTNNTINASKTSAVYNSSTDVYEITTGGDTPFVIIEATSITGNFSINDCELLDLGSNKWQLNCTVGTLEEQRSKIYKTLFYGTNGTDPRASNTFITGITAIKTNITRDVGKQAHYATADTDNRTIANNNYTGTFVNTSTNNDCSTWSYVQHTELNGTGTSRWEVPSGSTLNSVSPSNSSAINDETGIDLIADELNNPADCQLEIAFSITGAGTFDSGIIRSIILCEGDINWSSSGNINVSNTDFFTDNSIPIFTATSETIKIIVTADTNIITLDGTEKSICIYADKTIPTNTTLTVDISDGTTTLTSQSLNSVIGLAGFSSGNLELTFNLITTDTSVTPSLKGYGVYII